MKKENIIEIESRILEKIAGKIYLVQEQEDKEKVASDALLQISEASQEDASLIFPKEFSTEEGRNRFIRRFLSYEEIEELFCDTYIEDIIINSTNYIFVHHANKGLIKTSIRFETQKELNLFIRKLVVFSGRTDVGKLANLELSNLQGRVNIAYSPLGPQITITKAKSEPLSIINLIEKKTLTYDLAAQLWLYIEGMAVKPANIIISGGPGSGKTTLLNALFSFTPANERMVVIEDTLELNTELDESCSRMESDDDLTLADLVKNSLRMRPDRITIGEVRGEEARDMMTAVNIGKYCLGTIHASTARETILRMQSAPMNVPETLVGLVDVFLIMRKFNFKNKVYRAVEELSETGGLEGKMILLSPLWKYDYEKKELVEMSPSTIYRDKLSRITGIPPREIMNEIKIRAKLLEILHSKNLSTLQEVTTFCRAYNSNPEGTLSKLGFDKKDLLPRR